MRAQCSPGEEHEVEPGPDHCHGEHQLLYSPQLQQPQRQAAQHRQVGHVEQQLDRVVELDRKSDRSAQYSGP